MKKVLIVDDSSLMTDFIKTLIEKNGFKAIGIAENGIQGVNLYKKLHPDIVTMDIAMPEMDGIQSLKNILTLDPEANVLIISSMNGPSLVEEAILHGAKGFIMKPFNPETLINTLNHIPVCSSG